MERKAKTLVVTKRWLADRSACRPQQDRFARVFRAKQYEKGVPVTRANLLKAARAGLDIEWLTRQMISVCDAAPDTRERWDTRFDSPAGKRYQQTIGRAHRTRYTGPYSVEGEKRYYAAIARAQRALRIGLVPLAYVVLKSLAG